MISSKIAKGIASTLIALLAFSSCAPKEADETDSIVEETVVEAPVPTPWSYINRNVIAYIDSSEYVVAPIDTNLSYDDVISLFNDYLGIEESEYHDGAGYGCFSHGDYYIGFENDYQLSHRDNEHFRCQADYYQYLNREWTINGLIVYEFFNKSWADYYYRDTVVDRALYFEDELSDSSYTDGYCFRIGPIDYRTDIPVETIFTAVYYMGDYTIEFGCLIDDSREAEYYRQYLEFCELLGLPTSDEATQIILG